MFPIVASATPRRYARPVPSNLFVDLDGTLTDSSPGIIRCLRHALTELSIEPPPDDTLKALVGPPLHDGFLAVLGEERAALIPRAIELYRERFRTVGMFENSVYPGIMDALGSLSATRTLFVVTAKPRVFAERIAEHFEFHRFFRKIYGSEFSGERSHKRDLIAFVLEEERISPDDALMIGDRSHDVLGAIQNGVRAHGVLWGYGSRDELVSAGADQVHETVPDLVRALSAL